MDFYFFLLQTLWILDWDFCNLALNSLDCQYLCGIPNRRSKIMCGLNIHVQDDFGIHQLIIKWDFMSLAFQT